MRRGKKERIVNDRHVSQQYLDLQFDYISGLVYDTLYFRKLLSYTGNFELADLVAKLIRILKEGVCVFLFWVFFCSETHSIEHPNVNNKKGDSIVTKK